MTISPPAVHGPAAPPPSVRTAFGLYLTLIGLRLIGALVAALFMPRIARIAERHAGLPPDQVAAASSPAARAILLGLVLAVAAVELALVLWMRAGRNWARLVLAALGVVDLALVVADSNVWAETFATGPLGVISVLLQIVAFALLLAALSLMLLRPDAARYFRKATGPATGPGDPTG